MAAHLSILALEEYSSHEQRSLAGYSPCGHKSQTRLKQLRTHDPIHLFRPESKTIRAQRVQPTPFPDGRPSLKMAVT